MDVDREATADLQPSAEPGQLGPLEITGLVSLVVLLVAHLLGLWLLYRFARRV